MGDAYCVSWSSCYLLASGEGGPGAGCMRQEAHLCLASLPVSSLLHVLSFAPVSLKQSLKFHVSVGKAAFLEAVL